MGYDLHITRRESWADEGDNITAEEWLTFVESDPDFRIATEFPMNGPYFAVMSNQDGSEEWWLDWRDGQIFTKYPEPELIDKMVAIAQQLGATVQGDDGEIYASGDKPWETVTPAFAPPKNQLNLPFGAPSNGEYSGSLATTTELASITVLTEPAPIQYHNPMITGAQTQTRRWRRPTPLGMPSPVHA